MNPQQILELKTSVNGFGRYRIERDSRPRWETKWQPTCFSRLECVGQERGCESLSCERLVYLTSCFIGLHVEVQVLDGSVYSGIFHATNAEEDFGIILKMARLIKDGARGDKCNTDPVSIRRSKTLIIPDKELVQVVAKDVPVTGDVLTNDLLHENQHELVIDSCISQSRHVEVGRELEPWVPEDDDCPELDNIFDGPWNGGWDQFEVNETLFGVKSTFNEELYTTKLEKGPQMRELEMKASRIAREIEGEATNDLHLAEERGIQLEENLEIDEETRFSSVFRRVDDSGYDESEDILLDSCNDETFGGLSTLIVGKLITDARSGKADNGVHLPPRSFSMEGVHTSWLHTSRELYKFDSADSAGQLSAEHLPEDVSALDDSRIQGNQLAEYIGGRDTEQDVEKKKAKEDRSSKLDNAWLFASLKKGSSSSVGLSPNAIAFTPSHDSLTYHGKTSSCEPPVSLVSSKTHGSAQSSSTRAAPNSFASSTSDCGGAMSPSDKSTLNPHAKEFKPNPNAKSFARSQTPLRLASLISDGSVYYPANITGVVHMHSMPVGVGVGPSYSAHQPVIPQAYFPPSGPQMMVGHPQQFLRMPTYPAEMPYEGKTSSL